MAGKKAHKKSTGQLGDAAVKARKAKRHSKRLDYFSKKDVVLGNETKGWDKFVDYFKDNRYNQDSYMATHDK